MVIRYSAKLLEQKEIRDGLKVLTFSAPNDFKHRPGQYMVAIIKTPDGQHVRRQYSIASKENETGQIILALNLVKDGIGSPYLCNLKVGDEVEFQGPLGSFFLAEKDLGKELTFISAGTGIAPFRAMIDYALNHDSIHKVTLIAGYRHEENRLFHDEFIQMTKDHDNFEYHTIISRPKNPDYNGNVGRVQEVIRKVVSESFTGDIYICGLKKMIEEVGALLSSKGIFGKRVHFETYD